MKENRMAISALIKEMIIFSKGNLHDIDHFLRVWSYAKTIGELEELDEENQYLLEVSALTHDIACPFCREKYGHCNGPVQEAEGGPMVESFLKRFSFSEEEIRIVRYLVEHHHHFQNIDSKVYQILVEADFIANGIEEQYPEEKVERFIQNVMKTEQGITLAKAVFFPDKNTD